MTDNRINLSNGGMVVVMVGVTGMVDEYRNNPQVQFIKCSEVEGNQLATLINPDTIKAAILTEGIPKYHYTWITSLCERKKVPYLMRRSNQAIYDLLKSLFTSDNGVAAATQEDAKEAFVKGKLNALIPLIDFGKSNSENARNLMRECVSRGIKTTEGSLAQFVSNHRRKQSGTALPKSARPKLDVIVDLFDNMIKEMGDMRDFIIELADENRMLKIKVDKFKKAMEE